MIDVVVVVGLGFKSHTSKSLRMNLLLEIVDDVNLIFAEYHIMSGGWIDTSNKTLINLPISCPKGTMFLKSADASNKVKSSQVICEMEEVVHEVEE
jgi:hypothetical protein